MQTQRNEIGTKARQTGSGHIAKIVQRAKESEIATKNATDDYRKTCEVETLAQAAKTCRTTLNDTVAEIINHHDLANECRDADDNEGYEANMKLIGYLTPKVQEAEARLRTVNDKLMRAGLEITAERWDLLTAGHNYRARGCDHRLELIETALGSNKPKRPQKRGTNGRFASNQS